MDKHIKDLRGSRSRDAFKFWHKNKLDRSFYACDLDLVLVSFSPKGPIAAIDYKGKSDCITRTEKCLYNWLVSCGVPVYIIRGKLIDNPPDVSFNDISIESYEYTGCGAAPKLILIMSGLSEGEYLDWEGDLRKKHRKSCRPVYQ